MKHPALDIIEATYGLTFNPTLPYQSQLDQLSASGELSNRRLTNEVLFKLCELIDKQQQQIDKLTKHVDNLGTNENATIMPDSTKPIDPAQPLI